MTLAAQKNAWIKASLSPATRFLLCARHFIFAICFAFLSPIMVKAGAPMTGAENHILQYSSLASIATTSSLWFVPRKANDASDELSVSDQSHATLQLRWYSEQRYADSLESLLPTVSSSSSSRFWYLSWAKVHTGFGQFYENDTVRVSRTNGAGFDKPHWLFLKFTFKL